jgi:hypothetical protein
MKVYVLYKEDEMDFNQTYLDDVEIFENKQQAEQVAHFMNSLLSPYDREYNGWSVGEQRTVR